MRQREWCVFAALGGGECIRLVCVWEELWVSSEAGQVSR